MARHGHYGDPGKRLPDPPGEHLDLGLANVVRAERPASIEIARAGAIWVHKEESFAPAKGSSTERREPMFPKPTSTTRLLLASPFNKFSLFLAVTDMASPHLSGNALPQTGHFVSPRMHSRWYVFAHQTHLRATASRSMIIRQRGHLPLVPADTSETGSARS